MKFLFLSVGSFDANYSDYHLMRDLLAALCTAGHTVALVQKQYEAKALVPPELSEFVANGTLAFLNVPFRRAPHTSFARRYAADLGYYLRACRVMRRWHTQNGADAVFLQSNNTAFVPVRWAKKHGLPLLYSEQDIFPKNAVAAGMLAPESFVYRFGWALQRYAYKNAAHVITISEDMRDTILSSGTAKERVSVVYNWGHTARPCAVAEENNFFLQEHPQPPEIFRAVYAGNLGTMQNVELLLDAAALLRDHSGIRLFVIGSGARGEALLQQAERKKLANVTFLPMFPAEYALDLYAMAHVNLIPLHPGVVHTAMPSKLADCLAVNRPLIACAEADSHLAQLLRGRAGLCVTPPDDARALAEALRKAEEAWREQPAGAEMPCEGAELFGTLCRRAENTAQYCVQLEALGRADTHKK